MIPSEEIGEKVYVHLLGIDIVVEKVGNQIIMHVLDIENATEGLFAWTTIVHEDDFAECVQVKEDMGVEDPQKSAIADFALLGICVGDE